MLSGPRPEWIVSIFAYDLIGTNITVAGTVGGKRLRSILERFTFSRSFLLDGSGWGKPYIPLLQKS